MKKIMPLITLIVFCFSFSFAHAQTAYAVRGLRVDPGYLYDFGISGQTTSQIASRVVSDAQSWGFNTLYLYAYSSVYGAFYPTTLSMTTVEGDLGRRNIFGAITSAAKSKGMKVIAVLPVQDFKQVWLLQPSWRIKTRSGTDYKPDAYTYFLSVSVPGFKTWYQSFVNDFLARNPSVDGIEAVEPGYDLFWQGNVDYNSYAVNLFKAKYPGYSLTGSTYRRFRAQQLTEHLGRFSQYAHAKAKESHIVQTWTAYSNGSLYSSTAIRDGLAFDFNGVLNLPIGQRPDVINAEFMWQQWKAEYGTSVFTSSWVSSAAKTFYQFVNGRAKVLIHVELSEFSGGAGNYDATRSEVNSSVAQLPVGVLGYDVYDYALWRLQATGN